MSAYIVDKEQIEQIVLFCGRMEMFDPTTFYHNRERIELGSIEAVANVLYKENYRSVNYRYSEESEPTLWKGGEIHQGLLKAKNPIQILSYIQNLDYQSCESEDWRETLAFKILETYKDRIINLLIRREEKIQGLGSHTMWGYKSDQIIKDNFQGVGV